MKDSHYMERDHKDRVRRHFVCAPLRLRFNMDQSVLIIRELPRHTLATL